MMWAFTVDWYQILCASVKTPLLRIDIEFMLWNKFKIRKLCTSVNTEHFPTELRAAAENLLKSVLNLNKLEKRRIFTVCEPLGNLFNFIEIFVWFEYKWMCLEFWYCFFSFITFHATHAHTHYSEYKKTNLMLDLLNETCKQNQPKQHRKHTLVLVTEIHMGPLVGSEESVSVCVQSTYNHTLTYLETCAR